MAGSSCSTLARNTGVGSIYAADVSLLDPYYQLCEDALFELADWYYDARASRHILLAQTLISMGLASSAHCQKKRRPVILCPRTQDKTSHGPQWSYAMGTFGGHDEHSLPPILRHFALPIFRADMTEDEAKRSIRTSPPWKLTICRQWVIAIPIPAPCSLVPWCASEEETPYILEPQELRKLHGISKRLVEDFYHWAQDPAYLLAFARDLLASECQKLCSLSSRSSCRRIQPPSKSSDKGRATMPVPIRETGKPKHSRQDSDDVDSDLSQPKTKRVKRDSS